MNKKAFIPISALIGAFLLTLVAAMTLFVAEPDRAYAQTPTIEFAENGDGAVATFTAEDPEGATPIAWDIVTGGGDPDGGGDLSDADNADSDDFTIDKDGMLKFAIGDDDDPPDFENPADADTDNTYNVVVVACDVALVSDACPASPDGQAGYHKVTVKVTDVDEPGKVTWTTDANADGTPDNPTLMQFQVGNLLTATAEDGDITNATQTFTADVATEVTGVTWRWYRGGTEIPGDDAQDNTYTVTPADEGHRIRAMVYYVVAGSTTQETASLTSDYPVLATRFGANELEFDPPTVSRKVAEGDMGMMVGAPVTATGNHGAVNYTLGGTDVARFKIDKKTGQITTDVDLDREAEAGDADNCTAENACVVTVTATDASGDNATTTAVNIEITDVNEKPMFTSGPTSIMIPENSMVLHGTTDDGYDKADAAAVTYAATDPEEGSLTYHLMGPDASKFQLSSVPRVLSLKAEPDYEMPGDADGDNMYEVTVRASDGTLNEDRMVKVMVSGVDDAPVVSGPSSMNFAENGDGAVATFTAEDPEGATPIAWDIVTGGGDPDGGGDLSDADNADSDDFTIDKDGMLKFAIGDDDDPPDFENPADADTDNTYNVVVVACDVALVSDACPASPDGQAGYHKVTVKVTDVDEPGKVTWTTDANADGTPDNPTLMQFQVGNLLTATAEDGDITNATQTFTADVATEVTGVTWRWYRGGTEIPGDDAQDNTYTVTPADEGHRIRAVVKYNVAGNTTQETASLTSDYPVLATRFGANELEFDPPTVSRKVAEGDMGMMVGAPVTATGNHGAVNYTLGGTDVARFKIDKKTGQITTDVDLDREAEAGDADNCTAENACVVTVTATDASGDNATTTAVNIEITDVNEKPMFTSGPTSIMIPENSMVLHGTTDDGYDKADAAAVTYAATDPEELNVNLTLMGPDGSMFSLSSAGVLSLKAESDYEMPGDADGDNMYEVTVRASDGTLNEDRMVKVMVSGVDEAPVIMESGNLSISGPSSRNYAENGTGAVATYALSGPTRDMATWSLTGDDRGDFTISNDGMLRFRSSPDYESPSDANGDNVYMVTVTASDGANTDTIDLVVTVIDQDDTIDPSDLFERYDVNNNMDIDKDEALTAIDDYLFHGTITKEEMLDIVDLYLFGAS